MDMMPFAIRYSPFAMRQKSEMPGGEFPSQFGETP